MECPVDEYEYTRTISGLAALCIVMFSIVSMIAGTLIDQTRGSDTRENRHWPCWKQSVSQRGRSGTCFWANRLLLVLANAAVATMTHAGHGMRLYPKESRSSKMGSLLYVSFDETGSFCPGLYGRD